MLDNSPKKIFSMSLRVPRNDRREFLRAKQSPLAILGSLLPEVASSKYSIRHGGLRTSTRNDSRCNTKFRGCLHCRELSIFPANGICNQVNK